MFLLALALIGGSIWYVRKQPESGTPQAQYEKKALDASALAIAGADTDNDGLKDWEESLWKTDPSASDTDGDGTPDGEEVASKRNPTLRGPNDAMSSNQSTGDFLYGERGEQQGNLTEQFTKAFSNTIGPRVISGKGKLSASDVVGIANYLPSKESILASVPQVKASDLVVSPTNDAAHVKEYFAAVFAVYEKHLLKFKPNEDLEILQRALTSEDMSELAKLDPAITALEESFREVKSIPVPRGYEDFAVKELSYLLRSRRMAEIIRNADTDPLLVMAILELRIDSPAEIADFHRQTGKLLTNEKIAYANEKWGVMFR